MATVKKGHRVATVLVRVESEPSDQQALIDLMMELTPLMAEHRGFVSAHLHVSSDGTEIVQYLQWASLADHYNCMNSSTLSDAGSEMMAYIESGRASMEVRVYDVVASFEAVV